MMDFPVKYQTSPFRSVMVSWLLCAGLLFPAGAWSGSTEALRRAMDLSKQGHWARAIPEFEKVVQKDPENVLAWANLGVALGQAGKHRKALLAYENALRLGYDSPLFRYNRGISFARIDFLEEAEKEFKTALKMDPRMSKARYDLGIVYKVQGRNDLAFKLVDELYRKNKHLAKKLFDQLQPRYKIATVDNGGTLTGRIKLLGPRPKPRSFHLIHAPNIEFCSRISDGKGHRLLFDFTASKTGGFKDVVVALKGVGKGKPFASTHKMQVFKIDRCHSDQYVIGVNNGENILIENFDPLRHEIVTYAFKGNGVHQLSNKAVLGNTSQIRSAFVHSETREFLMKCNLHPFLQTRGVMVDNPYYTITDSQGRFSITDIPPGTYEVVAWHPFIPTQQGTITIASNRESRIDFDFHAQDVRRKLYHDDIDGYRFQPWFDSHEKFYGGPRIDDPVEILQKYEPQSEGPEVSYRRR